MQKSKQPIETDYVIVGAGSAGCVLAHRLSEDPNVHVVLVEAGGSDERLIMQMPSAFYLPIANKELNWGYSSDPEPNMGNRRIACPRGRVLGGSSSINGMVYVRGHRQDFDHWHELGATGWGYDQVLPYFKRAQHHQGIDSPDAYRGHNGPLHTLDGKQHNPLYAKFLEAAAQAGHQLHDDLNGAEQEGFGPLTMTIHKGRRASTAQAYLKPALERPNLHIIRKTLVSHINLAQGKATGVTLIDRRNRSLTQVIAGRETLVCAGAIGSPTLLQHSGIGPSEVLSAAGVETLVESSGVGSNLMDHLEVYVQQACTQPISLYRDLSLIGRAKIGMRWLLKQNGLGATNHFETGGFIRSQPSAAQPDIQFHFLPAAMSYDGSAKAGQHGFQCHVGPMLSPSRGSIRITSRDPFDAPRIRFNYMSHDEDWRTFRAAIRAARELFAQSAFDDVRGQELAPGPVATSDAALDQFVREHAESAYHPCGTCKMGTDEQAVVDPQGRVHGVENLRVADASVFPRITNGNLNAPTIMLAERMADFIRNSQSSRASHTDPGPNTR